MQEVINNFTIPENLSEFYHSNLKNEIGAEFSIKSNVRLNRDSFGRIISYNLYSPDNELIKTSFYEGSKISKINNYRQGVLYSTESYNNDLLQEKTVYKRNGNSAYNIIYEYNNDKRIMRLTKKTANGEILAGYKYDSFGRVIEKNISVDNKLTTKQKYKYDILDRVIEYEDANQHICVNKISQKNELISYEITDTIGNNIGVENHFTESGYICTKIFLNGHTTTVNDYSYVDNIMLKRPYTTEDDLDIIISNLFEDVGFSTTRTDYTDVLSTKTMGLVDTNIEVRTLPISLRKRVLYNTLVKHKE